MKYFFSRNKVEFHLKNGDIFEIYWPAFFFQNPIKNYKPSIGFQMPTTFLYRPMESWADRNQKEGALLWKWAICGMILGFGLGYASKHCDNKFRDELYDHYPNAKYDPINT